MKADLSLTFEKDELIHTENSHKYTPSDIEYMMEKAGLKIKQIWYDKNNLIVFLGSSFGNFSPDDGLDFLQKINSTMKDSDLFLIGLDLVKEKQLLENAYDDSEGITSQFNLNVLSRINRELDADFDLNSFEHHSFYNEEKKRIEIYLRSIKKQTAKIMKADLSLTFEKDELIHTENSHKYTPSDIEYMMEKAGLKIKQIWYDKNKYYSMVLAKKA